MRASLFAALAVLFLSGGAAVLAQTSELFLTTYEDTRAFVVRGGQVIRQFNRTGPFDGPALVVQNTIKMYGQKGGDIGREYSLNGNLLPGQYPNAGFVDCYDGATNGVRNWTVAHNDFNVNFAVIVADANWQNAQVAFVPGRRSSGITYDFKAGTLWLTNNVGGSDRVQQYSLGGQLLSEFNIGPISGGGYGIALDYADDTLWIPGAFSTAGKLYQYSKAGQKLQEIAVPGLSGNVLGAEFQIPEPASLVLLVLALAAVRGRRS